VKCVLNLSEMGKENKKGSRRRGSQAFQFEQSEETLQQNETICNLYQNKNYVPPDPGELEAIVEESTPEETQGGRARRAVDGQGAFAIGVRKEKRVIEPYKYWRVDNKDKNKKRKMMAGKLWKGRKRPKLESLTPDEEVYLSELIAAEDGDEECGDEERCVWGRGVGDFNSSSTSTTNDGPCVWGALEQQEVATSTSVLPAAASKNLLERLESSPQKRAAVCSSEVSKKPRIFDGREKRLEEREARKRKQEEENVFVGEDDDTGVDQSFEGEGGIGDINNEPTSETGQRDQVSAEVNPALGSRDSTQNDPTAQVGKVSPKKSLQRDPSNYLASLDASLTDLIPAEELEEMMSEDFLFCGGATFSKGRRDKGAVENGVNKMKTLNSREKEESATGRRRESTTSSRRRSARLSVHPNLTGSIFIEQEEPLISLQQKVVEDLRNAEPRQSVVTTVTMTSPSNTVTSDNTTAKPPDLNISMTPTITLPEVKSAVATPLFSNSIAPLRMVNKAKTKSRLGKEVQQALGDLTNFETKEGRLLKERTAVRAKGTRKGISLVEEPSPIERRKKGAGDKKGKVVKSTELSNKQQVVETKAKLSKESGRSTPTVSSEDPLERKSKEDRPRSGGEGSRRSSGLAGADLSLPESARRSITGEFVPQRSQHNSPAFQAHQGDSDSEEEVINCCFTFFTQLVL